MDEHADTVSIDSSLTDTLTNVSRTHTDSVASLSSLAPVPAPSTAPRTMHDVAKAPAAPAGSYDSTMASFEAEMAAAEASEPPDE